MKKKACLGRSAVTDMVMALDAEMCRDLTDLATELAKSVAVLLTFLTFQKMTNRAATNFIKISRPEHT